MSRGTRSKLIRAASFLAAFWLPSVASAGEIPGTVELWPGGPPAFVRLDALVDSAGAFDSKVLQDHQIEVLETYLRQPEENGCVRLRSSIALNGGPYASVKDATREAKLVLLGTVTGQAQGFSNTDAGTLFEVAPDEVLKGKRKLATGPYFVFFPIASFELKGKSFCATHPDYPTLPKTGDQVVVFFRDPTSTASDFLPLVDATDVIVIGDDSALRLPRLYRTDTAVKGLGKSGLLNLVRSYLGKEHQR